MAAQTYVDFVFNEVPAGTLNGTNKVFTLTKTPVALMLSLTGAVQTLDVDYTLNGKTITFTTAPLTTDKPLAFFIYKA
jgi:hypothetical protein